MINKLLKRMVLIMVPENRHIAQEGIAMEDFFFITRGECQVTVNGKRVATIQKGGFVGARDLLQKELRQSTISTVVKTQFLKCHRKDVHVAMMQYFAECHRERENASKGGGWLAKARGNMAHRKVVQRKYKTQKQLELLSMCVSENMAKKNMQQQQNVEQNVPREKSQKKKPTIVLRKISRQLLALQAAVKTAESMSEEEKEALNFDMDDHHHVHGRRHSFQKRGSLLGLESEMQLEQEDKHKAVRIREEGIQEDVDEEETVKQEEQEEEEEDIQEKKKAGEDEQIQKLEQQQIKKEEEQGDEIQEEAGKEELKQKAEEIQEEEEEIQEEKEAGEDEQIQKREQQQIKKDEEQGDEIQEEKEAGEDKQENPPQEQKQIKEEEEQGGEIQEEAGEEQEEIQEDVGEEQEEIREEAGGEMQKQEEDAEKGSG